MNSTVEDDDRRARQRLYQTVSAQAKAEVSRNATARTAAYGFAFRMADHVEQARAEIESELDQQKIDRPVRDSELAKRLNENGHPPRRGGAWSRTNIGKTLFRADSLMVEHAVAECRTRMTVLALSADFSKPLDAVHELERKYLDIIADALELGHRLRGERKRDRDTLLNEARFAAVEEARHQRSLKSMSMASRERLWRDFAPYERKVFDRGAIAID